MKVPSTLCSRLTAGDCSSTMPFSGFHSAFTRFPLWRLKIRGFYYQHILQSTAINSCFINATSSCQKVAKFQVAFLEDKAWERHRPLDLRVPREDATITNELTSSASTTDICPYAAACWRHVAQADPRCTRCIPPTQQKYMVSQEKINS